MMKKKTIYNIIMVALILVIAAGGVLTVGHIQGWFDKPDENAALLTDIRGIVVLEREGAAFRADGDTALREGDKISCESGATASIVAGDSRLALNEKSRTEIRSASSQDFSAAVVAGEVFVNAAQPVGLTLEEKEVTLEGTTALISVRTGTQSVGVFSGTAGKAKSGELLEWVGDEEGIRKLELNSLNDFAISQVRKANETLSLCFTNEDLDALVAERKAQLQAAIDQSIKPTKPQNTETTQAAEATEATQAPEETETADAPHEPSSTQPPKPTEPKETTPAKPDEPTPTKPAETKPTDPPVTQPPETEPAPTDPPEPEYSCTLSIVCDTILDNMEDLDPAKAGYVPSDGWILYTEVSFTPGETVFDVLKRACSNSGIQLEYSWTPMYNSYYIEGINNLYEFDCGPESGWMYKVNGWFPNYGCSAYTLSDGDNIVWCYTCKGLGADVGGSVG